MKKLILSITLLFALLANSQITETVVISQAPITTLERDALTVPVGEYWEIYNSTADQKERWNGSAWVAVGGSGGIESETDPIYSAWDKSTGISITESQISDFGTYLTSFTETDPIYSAWDKSTGISITESQISDFGSYLTAFTELDPVFTAWDKSTGVSITESQVSDYSVNVADLAPELKDEFAITGTDVDWSLGIQGTKTITSDITFSFSNYFVGKVITLKLTGDYVITWPTGVTASEVADYDGTLINYIDVRCVDDVTPQFICTLRSY